MRRRSWDRGKSYNLHTDGERKNVRFVCFHRTSLHCSACLSGFIPTAVWLEVLNLVGVAHLRKAGHCDTEGDCRVERAPAPLTRFRLLRLPCPLLSGVMIHKCCRCLQKFTLVVCVHVLYGCFTSSAQGLINVMQSFEKISIDCLDVLYNIFRLVVGLHCLHVDEVPFRSAIKTCAGVQVLLFNSPNRAKR